MALAAASLVGVVAFGQAASRAPACEDRTVDQRGDPGISCGLGQGIAKGLLYVSLLGLAAGAGIVVGGVAWHHGADASTTQTAHPREPTWVAPRAAPPGKAAFLVPLSFSF